jgi:RNA polymerase sigma factor (sigma-70 family)
VDQSSSSVTSLSLLMRLHQAPADQAAWGEFVAQYGPRIHGWCRQWGLQDADTQDVCQTVLMKLLRAMQTFHYDPSQSFRAWLKTVTHHAWQDLVRGRSRQAHGGAPATDGPLQSLAARDDLAARLEAAYEQELLQQALARVRARVNRETWDAFRLTVYDGRTGAETAAELGMPVTSVYKAKSNVQKLLEAEVRYLEGGEQ